MLQLTRHGPLARPDRAQVEELRRQFDAHWWFRLPGLLEPQMLADVQARLGRAAFVERVHPEVSPPSVDLSLPPGPVLGVLELVCNDPELYRLVEYVTGCDTIGHFAGCVYQMRAGLPHRHNWHNDLTAGRMVGMSVNVGTGRHEGGVLELRTRGEEAIRAAVPNETPGDAVLFALDPTFEHRVNAVTAGVKTAFVGWFCRGDRYRDLLRAPSAS